MTHIDKIRAALEQARELIPEYCGIRTQYDDAFAALAAIESELATLRARLAAIEAAPTVGLRRYDAGLMSDWGGGNVEWWWDYIRAELDRAHDYYAEQADRLIARPEAK